MEEKRTNNTRKGILIGCGISALLLTGFLGSYAYFMGNLGSNKQEEVITQTGTLSLTFADGNNGITQALEFGGSVEKTFSIQNTGSHDATARIMWDDLVNTYIDGSLTYTLSNSDTETGTFTNIVENQNVPVSATSANELLAGNLSIPTGSTKYYKLTIILNYLEDVDQTADLKASLSTNFSIEESDGKDLLLSGPVGQTMKKLGKTIKDTKPNFSSVATTDETKDGLFSMEDDYGTSYYYRGAVEDNYVKFGTWKEGDNTGKPMYWRIIRVNGNGSVRMIYDGTQAYANGTANTDRLALTSVAWNTTNSNDAKYVGYMYGGANGTASTKRVNLGEAGYADSDNSIYNQTDSNIKTTVEDWYKINIKKEDQKIEDVIYCNDRTFASNNTGFGFGTSKTYYAANDRVFNQNKLSLICPDQNDSFTVDDILLGNGKLDEKIGLITLDEANLAGEYNTENMFNYLYKGGGYWLLSPAYHFGGNTAYVDHNFGKIGISTIVSNLNGIAPVISLTSEYFNTLIGDGTMGNPFREKGMEP